MNEREALIKYYKSKMRGYAEKLGKPAPEFNVQKMEPYIRWTERRLRLLHQINECAIILTHLNVTVK